MLNTLCVVENNEGWQMLSSENKEKNVTRHTAGLSMPQKSNRFADFFKIIYMLYSPVYSLRKARLQCFLH